MNSTREASLSAIADVCAAADVTASFHVRSLDGTREIGSGADDRVVTASVYKVPVMLEVAAQVSEGRFSFDDRVVVPADQRTLGPSGISALSNDVELSIRDLGLLMIQVSDNTATDILQAKVGTANIMARLDALGVKNTSITTDCEGIIDLALEELSSENFSTIETTSSGNPFGLPDAEFRAAVESGDSLSARTGNTSTPRDMTDLLSLIWTDAAADAPACAEVRRVMGLQFAPHRLSSAFPDGVTVSGKTGTFFAGVRNEIGVVDFGNGEAYVVGIFLRNQNYHMRHGAGDAAIGKIAALAIDALRTDATPVGAL
ncbi:beta-lactamase class A [Rhodococcus sp. 27YEA15]|uniref:serine hydrolase n=1 Tax=Rhodococcus sp. 27YEA15 TaxID=3156259 RepID=UPI003C7A68D7